jgi:predicted RNase H-like HicB family nuclease
VEEWLHEASVCRQGLAREGDWYVTQCLELDIASQGESEDEALSNLKEALELYFEPPRATRPPLVRTIEVEVGAS